MSILAFVCAVSACVPKAPTPPSQSAPLDPSALYAAHGDLVLSNLDETVTCGAEEYIVAKLLTFRKYGDSNPLDLLNHTNINNYGNTLLTADIPLPTDGALRGMYVEVTTRTPTCSASTYNLASQHLTYTDTYSDPAIQNDLTYRGKHFDAPTVTVDQYSVIVLENGGFILDGVEYASGTSFIDGTLTVGGITFNDDKKFTRSDQSQFRGTADYLWFTDFSMLDFTNVLPMTIAVGNIEQSNSPQFMFLNDNDGVAIYSMTPVICDIEYYHEGQWATYRSVFIKGLTEGVCEIGFSLEAKTGSLYQTRYRHFFIYSDTASQVVPVEEVKITATAYMNERMVLDREIIEDYITHNENIYTLESLGVGATSYRINATTYYGHNIEMASLDTSVCDFPLENPYLQENGGSKSSYSLSSYGELSAIEIGFRDTTRTCRIEITAPANARVAGFTKILEFTK
jgi:hypothetical protein